MRLATSLMVSDEQSNYLRRTQRKPLESIVRQMSVTPASSQLRVQQVQASALVDQAPPRKTRFSPS
jgi:hypothetical protein